MNHPKRVTIKSFSTPIEAHVARTFLENEGIPCFVRDEHSIGLRNYMSFAMGGVRLDVPGEHAERALELLSVPEPEPLGVACPRCGARRSEEIADSRRSALAILLTFFAAVPVSPMRAKRHCLVCRHEWRGRAR